MSDPPGTIRDYEYDARIQRTRGRPGDPKALVGSEQILTGPRQHGWRNA